MILVWGVGGCTNEAPKIATVVPSGDSCRACPGPPAGMVVDATPTPVPTPPQLAEGDTASATAEDVPMASGGPSRLERTPPSSPEGLALPESVATIICSYPWDCATAVGVACSESELWPLAANPSGARGVFQLMPEHAWRFTERGWDYWTDWSDPVKNIAIAYELQAEQGWTPWMSSWPWSCN